ncbi:hypothetical protein TX24_04730 [Pseudomonas lactis]|nr:hypothetical protein TX24_04730 [Pseudomonas lactis]
MNPRKKVKAYANHCRRELAREKPENTAFNQRRCVIVGDLREQARSYRAAGKWLASMPKAASAA